MSFPDDATEELRVDDANFIGHNGETPLRPGSLGHIIAALH
jgi:hypothetical protein